MERAETLQQVEGEMTHIPKGPGEHQGMLRAIYRMMRTNSLGASPRRKENAGEVLHRCIAILWRDVPRARLDYDRAYFDG
jgi:hypothetical protein